MAVIISKTCYMKIIKSIWNGNKEETAKLIVIFEFRMPEHRGFWGEGGSGSGTQPRHCPHSYSALQYYCQLNVQMGRRWHWLICLCFVAGSSL